MGVSIFVRVLVIGVSVYFIATLVGLCNTLNEDRATLSALTAQYNAEKAEVEELKSILADGSQKELFEKEARRLGYVYPDEEIYADNSGK